MNEEERKSIKNLKKYIEEDGVYKKTLKYYSDFDKFCYNHCKDIDTVLILVEKLQKALVDEAIKSTEKIKQLNKGINTLMTKRKKWKNGYYNKKNKAKELNYKINKVIYKLRDVEEDYINVCPDCLDLSADLLKILEE